MDSRFYETKLVNHPIFKNLKINEDENNKGKLRNLLTLKDDVLYVWSDGDNCLLCLNLKRLEENDKETPHEKLQFLYPPSFPVERIVSSDCGRRLCVWGARGVAVAELPERWGRSGSFSSTICKSYSLDERFLYSQAEVRRVHWHPTSPSHVLVLVSDNTIRLYRVDLKRGPKLARIFTIGPKPHSQLSGRTILDSLGDTAVDFTACPHSGHLLILRGNGDIYMMSSDLEVETSPRHIIGPLAMYPPADDNYGTDSCCIAALGGTDTPVVVVVATSAAALYHCLLLPNAPESEESDSHSLYVVESVELDVSLSTDTDMLYSYPVHLYPVGPSSYLCAHAGGLHSVTLAVVSLLKEYAAAGDDEQETILSTVTSTGSQARHLLCTGGAGGSGGAGGAGGSGGASPPVGVACASLRPALVLCGNTLLVRTLEPYGIEEQFYNDIQLKNPALEQDDVNAILKERQKLSFTAIIQEILSRESSQPILKLNRTEEPSAQENLELLTRATLKLRSEYIVRQQRALSAITRKVGALVSMSIQQEDWIKDLQADIDDVQLQSMVLREKCALAEKHQDDIKYRCSSVIRAVRANAPTSVAERTLLTELERYACERDSMRTQIDKLKLCARDKALEMDKWREDYKKKDIALGKSHSDTISSILQQQTMQISALIEETKLLKDQLSLV